MKKNLLTTIGLVIGAAVLAYAGSYSVTTTAAQDTRLEKQRVRLNRASCQAVRLPNNCTQSQCRAVDAACDIYSDVADLIDRNVVRNYANSLRVNDTTDDREQFCVFWSTANTSQKNALCSGAALPNGCELCL